MNKKLLKKTIKNLEIIEQTVLEISRKTMNPISLRSQEIMLKKKRGIAIVLRAGHYSLAKDEEGYKIDKGLCIHCEAYKLKIQLFI